jgi:hypothetical protein
MWVYFVFCCSIFFFDLNSFYFMCFTTPPHPTSPHLTSPHLTSISLSLTFSFSLFPPSPQSFIGALMGGDDVGEDGGDPSQEELDLLGRSVHQFDDEVLGIVSAITGAPSVQSFREGFPLLSTQDLKAMRALFRRMGLGTYSTATATATATEAEG